jgi:hypothetical protein
MPLMYMNACMHVYIYYRLKRATLPRSLGFELIEQTLSTHAELFRTANGAFRDIAQQEVCTECTVVSSRVS